MADVLNPDYHLSPLSPWRNCNHDWKEIDSMGDNDVVCRKCGAPGERQKDGDVYWPAT